jgi:hypothetical protein
MQTNRDLDPDIVRSTYSTCEEQDIRHVFSHEMITRMKEEFFEIAADKTIEFWLESVEMHEAIQEQCQALIDGQIALFQEAGLTIVEQ